MHRELIRAGPQVFKGWFILEGRVRTSLTPCLGLRLIWRHVWAGLR